MAEEIAGIKIPDSELAKEATELVREAASDLIYDHSRRVYVFGALRGEQEKLDFDPELLYVGAMFHDLRLTEKYRRDCQRAEITAAHPRPDFKNQILQAFTDGIKHRPETTFGNVKADVLEHFLPGFERDDFVEIIRANDWAE